VGQAVAAAGHRPGALTWPGVGERPHLMSPAITLETHIADVINAIEMEEMDDVVLAVHSYAGMIGTAVADRMPGRLRHLVYVDAVVPEPGESWSSTQSSATREARLGAAAASPDFSFPAPDPAVYGLSGQDHAWVQRRQTPHPGHTYQSVLDFDAQRVAAVPRPFVSCLSPALATSDAIRLRLADNRLWGGAWRSGGGARVIDLQTGHDPMISAPGDMTRILRDCAA
jgi:pimeloyl-ACP methyl ester carboxylesterase